MVFLWDVEQLSAHVQSALKGHEMEPKALIIKLQMTFYIEGLVHVILSFKPLRFLSVTF